MSRRRIAVVLQKYVAKSRPANQLQLFQGLMIEPRLRNYSTATTNRFGSSVQNLHDPPYIKGELAPDHSSNNLSPPTDINDRFAFAVKRALKNEPDDEWDATFDNAANDRKIPAELREHYENEGVTDVEPKSLEIENSQRNAVFYDWQWKIIGTARLLESPLGSWTNDQWFSSENILTNGWPQQHCIRAVILQFALLRRACEEAGLLCKPNVQFSHPQRTRSEPTSEYKMHSEAEISPVQNELTTDLVQTANLQVARAFLGEKMLNHLIDNWRCVYISQPIVFREVHLTPREVLDEIVYGYSAKYGIPVSEKIFRCILAAEMHHNDKNIPEFAEAVLSHSLALYNSGLKNCFPTTNLWNLVLLSWLTSERSFATHTAINRLVNLMDELKVKRSRSTYRILFRECLQRETEDSARDAEALLRQMYKDFLMDSSNVQPDMSAFLYVIDAWAKSKSHLAAPRAEQIYDQMQAIREKNHLLDFGQNSETRLVNCVLMCWASVGTVIAAKKAESFWIRTGVTPDTTLYSTLISLFAKSNDVASAERLWSDMTAGIEFTQEQLNELGYSASALLNAYSKSTLNNKVELADSVMMKLKTSTTAKPDTACYNAYLKVLMNDSSTTVKLRAHEVLKEMREENSSGSLRSKPNTASYTIVMNGWAQKGNHTQVSDIIRLMYDDYIKGNKKAKPDVMVYNALVLAYSRSKESDSFTRSIALIDHMKKISNSGGLDVHPDVYTMSTALSCVVNCKTNLPEAASKAEEILNGMRESYENGSSRLQPNSYCYNSVIDAWARLGNPDKAESIFLQMCEDVNRGNIAAKPQTSTYNNLLKAWAFSRHPNAAERAEKIISHMLEVAKVKPDIRSYTILITCYGRSNEIGAIQKAENVLRRMEELHKKGILNEGPSHRTFLTLRKVWEESFDPNKVMAINAIDKEMMSRFPNEYRKMAKKNR